MTKDNAITSNAAVMNQASWGDRGTARERAIKTPSLPTLQGAGRGGPSPYYCHETSNSCQDTSARTCPLGGLLVEEPAAKPPKPSAATTASRVAHRPKVLLRIGSCSCSHTRSPSAVGVRK